jgi:hypothetical protein
VEQSRGFATDSPRAAAWLAWSLCTLSLALTALSFLLIALILSLDLPAYFFWLTLTVLAIGYSVIGAIIASRLPNHPIGWICCAIGFVAALDHFAGEYAVYALLARPEALWVVKRCSGCRAGSGCCSSVSSCSCFSCSQTVGCLAGVGDLSYG